MDKKDDLFIIDLNKSPDEKLVLLYDRFYDDVYRIIFYIVNNQEKTKELISDLFFNLWRNIDKLGQVENLRGYVVVSARHIALNCLSSIKRDRVNEDLSAHENSIADENTPFDIISGNELSNLIGALIEELPEKRKLIFKQSRIEGKSYNEISEMFGISQKTIEDHMRKALKFLKTRLIEIAPYLLTTFLFFSLLF